MAILVSNDDGVNSEGLFLLFEVAKELDEEVIVVAPDRDRSGVSRSVSLNTPFRCFRHANGFYSITGTPADCVNFALSNLIDQSKVDMVLAGINRGANLGSDVYYSGTLGVAFEASSRGILSIALSQFLDFDKPGDFGWHISKTYAKEAIKRVMKNTGDYKGPWNINFPNCHEDRLLGLKFTSVCEFFHYSFGIEKRSDPRGKEYFWTSFKNNDYVDIEAEEGMDIHAINKGYISISPVSDKLTMNCILDKISKK